MPNCNDVDQPIDVGDAIDHSTRTRQSRGGECLYGFQDAPGYLEIELLKLFAG